MAKLNPLQIIELCEKFEAAKGRPSKCAIIKRLAAEYGVKVSSINYQLLRNGIDPWDSYGPAHPNQPGTFSPEEDARMLELGRQGLKPYKISRIMERPQTSIAIRLMTLEVRAEKALEAV